MEQKTKIIIETDAGRSEQILQSVKKGMQDFGSETERAAQKAKSGGNIISSAFADISSDISKAVLTAAGFGIAIKSAYDIAKDASGLSEARQSLQTYAAEIGVSYEKMTAITKEATGRQIDDLKLVQLNHQALKNGVTRDVNDLGKLWEVSAALGDDYGKSMDEMFNTISDAITSGNGKALLSMGLLPASFKRASDAGTLLERRAELLKAVLEQAGVGAESLAKNGDTAADKFDRFEAAATNLKRALGEALLPILNPIIEGLTSIADAAGEVIRKFAQLADLSGPKNPFLGKTLEELQELRNAAANKVGAAQSNLSALTDPSQSYRRANESDITTKIMSAEVQYQGELAILKQIDTAMEKLQGRVDARKESEEKVAQGIADNAAKEAEAAEKKKLAGEAEKNQKKELEEAQNRLTKAIQATEKATTEASTAFLSGFGAKVITNLKDAESLLMGMTAAAGGFAVGLQNGTTEAGKMYEKLKKIDEYNENWLSMLRNSGNNAADDLRNLTPDSAMMGMLNFASGGFLSATGNSKDAIKDIKEPLAKTIAEAVQAGFANADFSNLSLTLGNIFTSILSKSVAQSNPVIDAAGSINFGNLGINLAASAVSSVLTRSGRFFGGQEEHGKEAVQKASDLRSQMGSAYVDSFVTEITSVFASQELKNAIADARKGYFGTSVGYSWNDSGDGIFSDRTRTYALTDNGASAALKKLTDAVGAAETASEDRESWINLLAARGYEYNALQEKVAAYQKASSYYGTETLSWSDGTKDISENLTKYTREVQTALAEMQRELGSATAERATNAAMSFAKYAPWLESMFMSPPQQGGNVRTTQISEGYSATVSALTMGEYYSAFERLQNDYSDRKVSPALLDIVKQSGKSAFDLEKLRVTGSDDYAQAYLDNVNKQINALDEVMKQQEAIFNNGAKTFEERSAALANYETAQEGYYTKKLEAIAAEEAAEEAVKKKELEAAARSRDRMASALNIYGEIAQAGTKIYVLTGGYRDVAYAELIKQNADNPAVVSALKSAETHNQAMVLWGEK